MEGLLVAPGVTDEDYTGEIKVMAHSPSTISVVQSGQPLAQLILLPRVVQGRTKSRRQRGSRGFGSSDIHWLQEIGLERPELILSIQGQKFKGLLDTGADVSVISREQWPPEWPTQEAITQLQA